MKNFLLGTVFTVVLYVVAKSYGFGVTITL